MQNIKAYSDVAPEASAFTKAESNSANIFRTLQLNGVFSSRGL